MIAGKTIAGIAFALALAAATGTGVPSTVSAAALPATLLSTTPSPPGLVQIQAREEYRGRRYREGRRDDRGGYRRGGRETDPGRGRGREIDTEDRRLRYAPPPRHAPQYRHAPGSRRDSGPLPSEERIMPLSDIMALVRPRVPGRVLNAQLHGNHYEIRIVTPQGRVVNVVADGRTGEILRIVGDR